MTFGEETNSKEMTIQEFAETTRRVVARDGFEDFLPTACYPSRRHVKTLVGLPPDVEVEAAVLDWAAAAASDDEEFLVAFAVNQEHFRVIRSSAGATEAETYLVYP